MSSHHQHRHHPPTGLSSSVAFASQILPWSRSRNQNRPLGLPPVLAIVCLARNQSARVKTMPWKILPNSLSFKGSFGGVKVSHTALVGPTIAFPLCALLCLCAKPVSSVCSTCGFTLLLLVLILAQAHARLESFCSMFSLIVYV